MSFKQMPLEQASFAQMPFEQMPVEQVSFAQMSFEYIGYKIMV
jgi:hypothetical protein